MLNMAGDIPAQKAGLRAMAKQRRAVARAANRDNGTRAGARIAANLLQAVSLPINAIVSGYHAMGDEADPLPALLALAAGGYSLCLPVTLKRGLPLSFRLWRPGDALEPGVWDIPVPPATAPEVEPDMLLVPLLAFDREGYRLGYGGGYYDRTLAALRGRGGEKGPVLAIGIAYAAQEVESVPREATDQWLDWIVTEQGAIRTDGRTDG
ncbi:MAG: 5-formyltetrahydrofolate cyclo-ligase [Oceanibaculum nanhaiense]|uniref:5-formyltetrahydrofolate cyclo-ligase n=1 Tax=Oceanibaculum nanhaiense TaxID=1909734 RepID=UPI0025A46EDE|nr:5-formyltetrahydrofolate cyclo-ligase [Oceanibaculum nanhaiense]MDM7947626.1 5-formyltetrahydrofolate cyclo-ligase [Oceanibaculum nanhaiense]